MKQHALAMAACLALAGQTTCSEKSDDALPIRSVPPQEMIAQKAQTFSPIVLVTIDGARWQDVLGAIDASADHAGKTEVPRMPVLRELATTRGAAIGAAGFGRIDATGPNFVSMPGYTEIFTGHVPACTNNECGAPDEATFADTLAARGASVAVFASWEKIARATSSVSNASDPRNGRARFLVSAGKQDGDTYEPYPGCGEYRPDKQTEDLALMDLETNAPDVLVIDLGDPDEYAHRGDHKSYVQSLEHVDAFLNRLENKLVQLGERGRDTTLMLTSDHGRAENFRDHGAAFPESSRTWLVAAGPRVTARGFIATRDHHLADIASTLMALSTQKNDLRAVTLSELFAEPELTLR